MRKLNNLMSVREVRLKYIPDSGILKRKKITSAHAASLVLLEGYDMDTIAMQEQFVVLLVNRANFPLGIYKASSGGMSGTYVDIRLLMVAALKSLASGIIISHNHPNGLANPSEQDKVLTKQVKEACNIMGITLLDHVIVTPHHEYFSFADEGLL